MSRTTIIALTATVLALTCAGAQAHHSFAMFDKGKKIELKGTVKEFQWVNPHTWIQIMAPYKGKVAEWSIEGRSPNVLARRGWTKSTVRAGDEVTLVVYPLKNGDPGGAIVAITLPNGKTLDADTPTAVDTDEERIGR